MQTRRRSRSARSAGSEAAPRRTGIHLLGEAPWGTHLCVFYESAEDLLDTCVSYFEAGLADNEFCVWAVSDSITVDAATDALHRGIAHFDRHTAHIEILPGKNWYLRGDEFDLQRITGGWNDKLAGAIARGYAGLRISGNAFWIASQHWKEFCEYEAELDRSLDDRKMLVLCTYQLEASRAVDILDVARAHQATLARRNGAWEFLETPELRTAKREIDKLNDALEILSKPFPGHRLLTPRERVVLAHIVKGETNKEIARALNIGPRTVEFHRANIMRKLGARNAVDLVRGVVAR
jgi:DNA-binding CsgD family transcriptional regulator